ncbi:unnamed protein product [Polarella glacialis]|nr:unnamed protein product [Polarella glacialis]|mmetsp:Transcript_100547/g.181491  ORF Transcript_100547/g.181491 Transcript_100547/m.181491 type:complete len:339 (+) Transcript_100547:1578-2594(+)
MKAVRGAPVAVVATPQLPKSAGRPAQKAVPISQEEEIPVQKIESHFENLQKLKVLPPEMAEAEPEVVATMMHERWMNIGKSYAQSSLPQEVAAEPGKLAAEKLAAKAPVQQPPAPAAPVLRGRGLSRGHQCSLCSSTVGDSASGVLCFCHREDGTTGGCNKGVCWTCMKRASPTMFGKIRITKAVWLLLETEAWWMHEKCMSGSDEADYRSLVADAEESVRRDEELRDQGWEIRKSKSTGKIYYVNQKLAKTQWERPEQEAKPASIEKESESAKQAEGYDNPLHSEEEEEVSAGQRADANGKQKRVEEEESGKKKEGTDPEKDREERSEDSESEATYL